MKKMKLAVAFAALTSAFTLSSCLNGGESTPMQLSWPVNIVDNVFYGGPTFAPDCIPGVSWNPHVTSLTGYGIPDGTKRAYITYTVPEGQDLSNGDNKKIDISLVAGSCIPIRIARISDRPDTLADYKTNISKFQPTFGKAVYTNNQYLVISAEYKASKAAKVGLVPNRVSNDTLYLDLKLKAEEGSSLGTTFFSTNYDLASCMEYLELQPIENDSVHITVRAMKSEYGQEEMDSVTTKLKKMY